MSVINIYFHPELYERLDRVARSFCLSKRDFVRAVVVSALKELEREQASTEKSEVERCNN